MDRLILGLVALIIANGAIAVKIKLKVHPEPDDKSKLIWMNQTTAAEWSEKLDNFLEVYRYPMIHASAKKHVKECDYDNPTTSEETCIINTEKFTPCISTNYFGYKRYQPCVFLELEKMEGWYPKYYNNSKAFPKSMPQTLKDFILQSAQEPHEWENIWVSCDGDIAADKELVGPVRYFPQQAFPGYLFPYVGQKHYFNPIVAVQFPKMHGGIIINVVCKIWGPGIEYAIKKSIGAVSFEILLD